MKRDKILCIVGRSGSGKTTIAEFLEKRGYTSVQSYVTRPPRFEGERGHTFVSDAEFDNLTNILAYNEYNGYRYCTTMKQIEKSDVYVVDIPGLKMLREKYCGPKKIVAVGLLVSEGVARERMLSRGDSIEKVKSRISEDAIAFKDLDKYCDFLIDSSYLSPEILSDIIISTLSHFPSATKSKVGDLNPGDRIWLGEEFYVVYKTPIGCVAVAKNNVETDNIESIDSLHWKSSKIRNYLNQEYMYKLLDHISYDDRPYDALLGLKMQNMWDKVGLLSPEEFKDVSMGVPDIFLDSTIIFDLNTSDVYSASYWDGYPAVSPLCNDESMLMSFKPVVALVNEAEVTLMEG